MSELWSRTVEYARVVANVDGWTYRWMNGRKTGLLYRAMAEAGATNMHKQQ